MRPLEEYTHPKQTLLLPNWAKGNIMHLKIHPPQQRSQIQLSTSPYNYDLSVSTYCTQFNLLSEVGSSRVHSLQAVCIHKGQEITGLLNNPRL